MKRILATVLVLMMMVGCASVSAEESYDIVFIPKGVADFCSIAAGFEQAAKDAGMDCRVIYPTKRKRLCRLIFCMMLLILSRMPLYFFSVNADPLVAPSQTAMEENIPVILVDTLIGTDDYVNAYMTDNVAAGAMAAEEMVV